MSHHESTLAAMLLHSRMTSLMLFDEATILLGLVPVLCLYVNTKEQMFFEIGRGSACDASWFEAKSNLNAHSKSLPLLTLKVTHAKNLRLGAFAAEPVCTQQIDTTSLSCDRVLLTYCSCRERHNAGIACNFHCHFWAKESWVWPTCRLA